jgi:hypothetical protein
MLRLSGMSRSVKRHDARRKEGNQLRGLPATLRQSSDIMRRSLDTAPAPASVQVDTVIFGERRNG